MVFFCGFIGARAVNNHYFGKGTGPVVLEVGCTGLESSLFECDFNYGNKHNYCDGDRFAGVVCQGNTINSLVFDILSALVQNVVNAL